jgi:hypothetical protein
MGSKFSFFFTLISTFLDTMTEDSELVETCINYMLISQFQESQISITTENVIYFKSLHANERIIQLR